MTNNPYQKEIIGILILGTLLLLVETWRRWDNLLSYTYFEDVILVLLGFTAAYFLIQKTFLRQLLWLFTCGYAMCLITGSFVSTCTRIGETDASGFSMIQVLLVKTVMYSLVIAMSIRAFRLLKKYQFK